jgi:hypothetical protein
MPTISNKQIIRLATNYRGYAVEIDFTDPDWDWRHYRIEQVNGSRIALTGMTDEDGTHHDGDFFWVDASDIKKLKLRT